MAVTIGCFNRPWNTLPLQEAFEWISRAGFKHVGLFRQNREFVIAPDTPPDRLLQVGDMAKAAGLTISVLMASVNVDAPVERAVDDIAKQADNAVKVGAKFLLTMGAGPVNRAVQFPSVSTGESGPMTGAAAVLPLWTLIVTPGPKRLSVPVKRHSPLLVVNCTSEALTVSGVVET